MQEVEVALSLENRLGLKDDDEEKGITWLTVSKDKNGPCWGKAGEQVWLDQTVGPGIVAINHSLMQR